MSFNKENEMIDNDLYDINENSGNCSKPKISRKNSLNYKNGNNSKDLTDRVDGGLSPFENIKLSFNFTKSNGKSHDNKNLSNNFNKEKVCFDNYFFKCLKYVFYKKEFKDKFNKGIAENNYYLINKQWVLRWKIFTNYKTFKKFFCQNKILDYLNLISLDEEKFLDEENLEKFEKDFFKFISENDLFLNSVGHPGEIDNYKLLKKIDEDDLEYSVFPENYALDEEKIKSSDILSVIGEKLWLFFFSNFSGGPCIERKPVNFIEENQKLKIEIYLLKLNIIVIKNKKNLSLEGNNIFHFKCSISKNKYLSDMKELVKKKLLSLMEKEKNHYLFFRDKDFCDQIKDSNSENFTINVYGGEQPPNYCYNLFRKINQVLQNKLADANEKILSINSNNFENIDFDTQNSLFNLNIDNEVCLLIELTDENTTTIFNLNKAKKSSYVEGDCSKCFKRKILFYNCICLKFLYCSKFCYNKGLKTHIEDCIHYRFQLHDLYKNQDSQDGICGLSNLGNTCYMNTALQCLSNCKELTEYFIKGYFLYHINTKGNSSTKGKLADEFCFLLKNLWYNNQSYFSPTSFKGYIGRLNQIFMGFEQHDTHEFLNFFLDQLNDELNIVNEKPNNILSSMEENEPDIAIKSDIYWNYIKQRNQSIITDLFFGQYMSTIKCPVCFTISTNFDPFLTLTLPIFVMNQEKEFSFECYFIFFDLKISPLKISFNVNRKMMIYQLRKFLGELLKINPLSFYIYNIGFGTVGKILKCSDSINSDNSNKRIFIMQIDPKLFNEGYYSKYQDYLKLNEQINDKVFCDLNNKINFLTVNSQSKEDNIIFLQIENDSNYNSDKISKNLNNYLKSLKDQPYIMNQLLKEILEKEEAVSEGQQYSPIYKTIGFYSSILNKECEENIDILFEILTKKIFETPTLKTLLREKLKEFKIKKNKGSYLPSHGKPDGNHLKTNEKLNSIDNYIDSIEICNLKNLLNGIKEFDINEKIIILNYFNLTLDQEIEFNKISYNSDENNYLHNNFLKCTLDFCNLADVKNNGFDSRSYSFNQASVSSKKENFISPAVIITIRKEWSLRYLNEYIFSFLKNLIEKDPKNDYLARKFLRFDLKEFNGHHNKKELFYDNRIPFMILIKPVFLTKKIKVLKNPNELKWFNGSLTNINENICHTTVKEQHKPILNSIYYEDDKDNNIQNLSPKSYNGDTDNFKEVKIKELEEEIEINLCIFCENEKCEGCVLPDDDNNSISDLLNKYKDFNLNYDLTNEFLYLNEISENNPKSNLDFRLEIAIQNEYNDCITSIRNVNINNLKFDAIINKEHNLIKCFENFQREENLEKTNEWKCPKCNDFRQANKKIEIYRAPKILIIHLNRFSHIEGRKINTEIDFPKENLDLNKFIVQNKMNKLKNINDKDYKEEENIYDLFAIANHYGNLDGGHYIAGAKNFEKEEWFQYNDSNVSRIKELNKSSAYLLFYRQKSLDSTNIMEFYRKDLKK